MGAGSTVSTGRRGRAAAAAALLALLLPAAGCAGPEPSATPETGAPPSAAAVASSEPEAADGSTGFASVEQAYDAVAAVLPCASGVTAEPVSIMIDGHLPEYAMCTEAVQVVRYPNAADREKGSALLDDAEPGSGYRAEGSNWQVLVLPGRAGYVPSPTEVEQLAAELGGRYVG